jgi:hypothetical protein
MIGFTHVPTPGGPAERRGDTRRSPGNGAVRVLCSLTPKPESGHDISISDRARSRLQGIPAGIRGAPREMAARVSGQGARRSPAGDLAIGAAGEIAVVMGWSLPYTLGVLGRWKMAPVYCQAVLCYDQRIALDGSPAETVDAEAKNLATKQLARLAARKAAKKAAEAAAPAVVKPKPAQDRSPRRRSNCAPGCVQRCCAGAHSRASVTKRSATQLFRSVLRERIERHRRPQKHSLSAG